MNELYTFEGLCNRLNGLASALLKWEAFRLRWMINPHCPLRFSEIFEVNAFPEIDLVEDPGAWKDYQYCDGADRHCYFFLRTGKSRDEVKRVYRRILNACWFGSDPIKEEAVAVHFRNHFKWGRAGVDHTVEAADWLATRSAAERIIVGGDDAESISAISSKLESYGHEVVAMTGGLMSHDYDRPRDGVERFCQELISLTSCRWAYSNAPNSTVLDASRALGNEVWTSGDISERTGKGCHLFCRCGFDLLTC